MNKIKKTSLCLLVSIILLITFVFANTTSNIFVSADKNMDEVLDNVNAFESTGANASEAISIQTVFDNQAISRCEDIYNLDDSADYICVEFERGGYVIFAKQTMEMMEYSMQGCLPYGTNNSKKYYAGPTSYIEKINGKYVDASTDVQIEISETEAIKYAQNVRRSLITDKLKNTEVVDCTFLAVEKFKDVNKNELESSTATKSSAPVIDTGNLIPARSTGTFIPNAEYFAANPTHGDNDVGGSYGNGNSGTCGPVAAQLLLGYNNFYNDRRIIPNRFLNGYDDTTNTVINEERNPNFCSDPMTLNSWTTGTRSEDTGSNSFYFNIITYIMKPNTSGATNKDVYNGMDAYLEEYISPYDYSLWYEERGWLFGYNPIGPSTIKLEINSGRPLIISMDTNLGGADHFVVGYGYQDYTYPSDMGTYSGYVVHFGWQGLASTSVWINESWCDGYIALKMNHVHNYSKMGAIGSAGRTEYRCTSCGQRTDAAINMTSLDRYVERVANLPQNNGKQYQDYYVTFKTAGNKLFQTFGTNDVVLYLYDSEYNQLAYNDDSGYNLNSLFNYTVEVNIPYILRVQFYNTIKTGSIKIGITPASVVYSSYEDIWHIDPNVVSCCFTSNLNTTRIICYTPNTSGTYKFTTYSSDDIDTYLYFIDPSSTNACLYNDDGAGNYHALIQTDLIADRRYFLIVSAFDITTKSGAMRLYISKIS